MIPYIDSYKDTAADPRCPHYPAFRPRHVDSLRRRPRIAHLAKQVQLGKSDDTPAKLNTPAKRALYNNLNQNEALALQVDDTVRRVRPNAFRGNTARENVIKRALLPLLGDDKAEVERIFLIIKAQSEY